LKFYGLMNKPKSFFELPKGWPYIYVYIPHAYIYRLKELDGSIE